MADRVGALAALTSELATSGSTSSTSSTTAAACAWPSSEVEVQVTVETRDLAHHAEVVDELPPPAGYRVEPGRATDRRAVPEAVSR